MLDKLFEDLKAQKQSIAIVGLGYVGLPLAINFARRFRVIGFDIDAEKIAALKDGQDDTGEVSHAELEQSTIRFSADPEVLSESRFIVVAVPTPIDNAKIPNLEPLKSASRTVGQNLQRGAVVVFESTVFPGATEDICIPILEETSGKAHGNDFSVAYSPERINPGDKEHSLDKIVKVVGAQDEAVLELVAKVYGQIISAGIHRAPSIRAAEAAKIIENTQRDLNIALMNELAILFNRLGIDTRSVLEAAVTKWNFAPFTPGLVGGHCIGVDPYYLTFLAQRVGYSPQVILAGRRINDAMGKYVAEQTVKHMIRAGIPVSGSRVLILGLTFKENVPDLRNSKVVDIVRELEDFNASVMVHDPLLRSEDSERIYGIPLTDLQPKMKVDAIILAVPHRFYLKMGLKRLREFGKKPAVLIDVKSQFDREEAEKLGFHYWRL